MYQPELGRFLQPDPKQVEAGDYDLYRYCHNDPVNKSDPTGLTWWSNIKFLARWLSGFEDRQKTYNDSKVETREMANSPGVNALRERFMQNKQDIKRFGYSTSQAYKDTLVNPKTADWSKTSAQVGGFDGAKAKK